MPIPMNEQHIKPRHSRMKPVKLGDIQYPSVSAAARAIGVSSGKLSYWLYGEDHLDQKTVDILKKYTQGKPVTIEGVRYTSMYAAHKATGLSMKHLRHHMSAGTLDQIGKHPYCYRKQPGRYGNPLKGETK